MLGVPLITLPPNKVSTMPQTYLLFSLQASGCCNKCVSSTQCLIQFHGNIGHTWKFSFITRVSFSKWFLLGLATISQTRPKKDFLWKNLFKTRAWSVVQVFWVWLSNQTYPLWETFVFWWHTWLLSFNSLYLREDLIRKRTFSFGHCPN